ncbi:MAG: hypothetical protein R3B09_01125 [Nannocystaceae bacterium]
MDRPDLADAALRYLYIGSRDTEADLAFHLALGGRLIWRFQRFGADVAAVRRGDGPALLLADHRPPGGVLPIWAVPDLDAVMTTLRARGLELGEVAETPDGPVLVLRSPSGAEIGVLGELRPGALEGAYRDPGERHAVRSRG